MCYWIGVVCGFLVGGLIWQAGIGHWVARGRRELESLKKRIAEIEAGEFKAIVERDNWREFVTEIAELLGCKEQWSSSYHDHRDCIRNAVKRLR